MAYFIARNSSTGSIQIGDDYLCYSEVVRGSLTVKDRTASINGTSRSYIDYSGSTAPILVIRDSPVYCCLVAVEKNGSSTRWFLVSDVTGSVNYSIIDRVGIVKASNGINIRNASGSLVYSSDMRQIRYFSETDRYENHTIPASGEYGFVASSTGYGFSPATIGVSGTMVFCAGHRINGLSMTNKNVEISFSPTPTNEFSDLSDFYSSRDGSYTKLQILRLS